MAESDQAVAFLQPNQALYQLAGMEAKLQDFKETQDALIEIIRLFSTGCRSGLRVK